MFLFDYMMILIGMLMIVIGILVSVAYLTLLERKVLGYIQIRKGPNKLGVMGLLQPFADGLKLFSKELVYPYLSNYIIYFISPVLSFVLSLFLWLLIPYYFNMISFGLGFMFFFCCTSVGVYMVMVSGWSSNSIYSLLGSLRSIAQTISYEVSMIFIMLSTIILLMDFNLLMLNIYQYNLWFIILMFPLSLMMMSSMLAEVNRAPFDFAEGESELVSGFNIEYSGGGFSLIFLAEYSSILFMSMMFILLYCGGYSLSIFFYLKLLFIAFLFIWVRGSLPRYRYDKLMYLCWKYYLLSSLNFFFLFVGLMIFLF